LSVRLSRRTVLAAGAAACIAGCTRESDRSRVVRVLHIETNRDVLALWDATAQQFMADFPGVEVAFRVLEAEAFRARLATLLQSTNKPDIFYSWGGALIDIHRNAGLLEDISPRLAPQESSRFAPTLYDAYGRSGDQFGLPYLTAEIGLIINRAMFARLGIAETDLASWPGFLSVVRRCRQANVVPIAVGGMDRWQISLLHSHICLQLGGKAAANAALWGETDGFLSPTYIEATNLLRELLALQPFQPGAMSVKAQSAVAAFVRGDAAMTMHGSWFYRQAAALGIAPMSAAMDNFQFVRFPVIADASIPRTQTQGQINGWLVSKGASEHAIEFLRRLTGAPLQGQLAAAGFIIPADTAAQAKVRYRPLRETAQRLSTMDYLQTGWPSLLGPNGGGAALDAAAGLATGQMDAREALGFIEKYWTIEKRENGIQRDAWRVG
jgi:raffinose/stachyose/melibiose transport system substrate-binding protein